MTENKKRILVTGGKGFLGRHLIEALKRDGYGVETFDLAAGQDIVNPAQVDKHVKGNGVVFHLAAVADLNYAREHPLETVNINITGTINVAEACRKHKSLLIYASTCCVYGNADSHPVDESTCPMPTEIYAHSKLAGEHVVRGYADFGLRYNILRLATFYGEEMRGALAPYLFLKRAMEGRPLSIHGDGTQTRTFTHVGDIVEGMTAVLRKDIVNEIVNLTTEEQTSILDMARMACGLTGKRADIVFAEQRPGQIFVEIISAQKAKKLLGWEATTRFQDGFERLHRWMSR